MKKLSDRLQELQDKEEAIEQKQFIGGPDYVVSEESMNIQGYPKLTPPLPGRNEKCSIKTEDSIFKYNLFKKHLESFMLHNRLFMSG